MPTLPRAWQEDDIQSLITNGVKESLELDYKACDSLQKTDGKKAEVSKDVSAFANSAGGVLIYGVQENGHVPTDFDVGYDPSTITKEWLEQVINSNIHPRLDRVYINQVELSRSRPGRVLYVVEIPQSIARAPHQASDKRYYKRFNFESVPMEDFEIRDIMRRAQGPDLFLEQVTRVHVPRDGDGSMTVVVKIGNRGRVLAEYTMCICKVVTDTFQIATPASQSQKMWVLSSNARSCQFSADTSLVIHADTSLELEPITFVTRVLDVVLEVEFSLYAKDMLCRRYKITVDPRVSHAQAVSVAEISQP